mgnify:CR=1 FL=1
MIAEYNALMQQNVWTMCTLPAGKRTIGNKWVFKTKYNADGTISKYKARLVAKGYNQQYGIDYKEIFAPVVKMTSLRLILSIAAYERWEIHQMDVDTAFLNAPVQEEIYMDQPEGFEETDSTGNKLVCRLCKSLYGTK